MNSLYLIPQQNSNTEYNTHSPLGGSHSKMFSRKAPFKDSFPGITVFRLFLQNYHSEHFELCGHTHPKMQFSTASSPIPAAVGMTAAPHSFERQPASLRSKAPERFPLRSSRWGGTISGISKIPVQKQEISKFSLEISTKKWQK